MFQGAYLCGAAIAIRLFAAVNNDANGEKH